MAAAYSLDLGNEFGTYRHELAWLHQKCENEKPCSHIAACSRRFLSVVVPVQIDVTIDRYF